METRGIPLFCHDTNRPGTPSSGRKEASHIAQRAHYDQRMITVSLHAAGVSAPMPCGLFGSCIHRAYGEPSLLSSYRYLRRTKCIVTDDAYRVSKYHVSLSTETGSYSHSPILVILQCDQLSDSVSALVDHIHARTNASIYVTTTSGSFQSPQTLWNVQHPLQARVVHCSLEMCDNVVFSLIAYEGYARVVIVRVSDAPSMDAIRRSIDAGFSPQSPFVGVFDSERIRSIMTHPCFSVEYRPFNVIDRIHKYENGLSCSTRSVANNRSAVVLTAFKRTYFTQVLETICRQTSPPSLILFIQNMAFISVNRTIIPRECGAIPFQHVWLSNWNSFSYMRHFIPIPSDIHTTILVDDDMMLTPSTFEHMTSLMRANRCVATERGRRIDPSVIHDQWTLITSASVTNLTIVDYAFIPQFLDTEWRKGYWKVSPFSRRYGDILFVASGLYRAMGIPSCVAPQFQFFEKDEGDDALSTSKSHSAEYNQLYSDIAKEWVRRGYVPVTERVFHVCFESRTHSHSFAVFVASHDHAERRRLFQVACGNMSGF